MRKPSRSIKQALRLKPDPQVRLNLALAYYKVADLSNAVVNLKRVRKELPDNIQILTSALRLLFAARGEQGGD